MSHMSSPLPLIRCALLLAFSSLASLQAADIPSLTWTPRSDWINVKTDVTPAAVGDGVADDTAAIQAAMNLATSTTKKTVYLPAGTYKISSTLAWNTAPSGRPGLALIGCGRDTILRWAGASGGTMFRATGATRTRYIGLTWDGQNSAAHAYNHDSQHAYETRIRHENEAFLNFTVAAIMSGNTTAATPTAETFIWNCLFRNNTIGVVVGNQIYNYYQWYFDGCQFENNGTGIQSPCGKIVILNTHFSNSSVVDVQAPLSPRLRRCTSTGSALFFRTGQSSTAGGIVLQDCHVSGWTNANGAIVFGNRGPIMIFDCSFTNPPNNNPPMSRQGSLQQNVITSNNTHAFNANITTPTATLALLTIPVGTRGPSITSASREFLKSTWPADSTNIIDVKLDHGAVGNGTADDTAAIQAAINAARTAGSGAIVYFPNGKYKITNTLLVQGSNYKLQGGGFLTSEIVWAGPNNDSMIETQDVDNVSLEQFKLTCDLSVNGILATSAYPGKLTVDGIYYTNPTYYVAPGPGLALKNLPQGYKVDIIHLDGPLTVDDCGAAEVLLNYSTQGPMTVRGGTLPRTGFFGAVVFQGGMISNPNYWDVTVEDNQNLVIGDYYDEQTYSHLRASKNSGPGPSRITIQGIKQHSSMNPVPLIQADNYQGQILYSMSWITNANPVQITQTGSSACTIAMLGNVYSNNIPTVTLGSGGQFISVLNILNTPTPVTYLPDVTIPGADAVYTKALDHLRELGAMNLQFRHP